MERTKQKRVRKSPEEIQNAVKEVITQGLSIRSVAKSYGIAKSMLARLVKKCKNTDAPFIYQPNIGNRRIFSMEEEFQIAKYVKLSAKMCFGLTRQQLCRLAADYAKLLKKDLPANWIENEVSGIQWYKGFMKRHPEISLRRPEKTSLARATSFNKTTVATFYNNLKMVLDKYQITPDRIYNLDETGLLTVCDPLKVLAQTGMKQVGQVTSAERGQLVTMLGIVSATGNSLPPVFIFPRVHYKPFMLTDGPVGSLGLAYRTGWMTNENFLRSFQYFIERVKPSQETPVLLLMDNHETHISLEVILRAKENGVIILTFPPHCSHRLQPLDVTVYGPFKSYYKRAMQDWMTSNPGQSVTIYTVPKFAKIAYEKAFTIETIVSGFDKTGIHPFNSNKFTDADFLSSYVTDRPLSTSSHLDETDVLSSNNQENNNNNENSHEDLNHDNTEVETEANVLTPDMVRPFPKAAPRQQSRRGRKRGSSKIMTTTPEIAALKESQLNKKNKRQPSQKALQSVKRKILEESSSDESSVSYVESDASETWMDASDSDKDFDLTDINVGSYIVVKFQLKKHSFNYAVGVILSELPASEYQVKFMKKSSKTDNFTFPEKDDIADVNEKDIVMKLPNPNQCQGSKRAQTFYSFSVDLSNFSGLM